MSKQQITYKETEPVNFYVLPELFKLVKGYFVPKEQTYLRLKVSCDGEDGVRESNEEGSANACCNFGETS